MFKLFADGLQLEIVCRKYQCTVVFSVVQMQTRHEKGRTTLLLLHFGDGNYNRCFLEESELERMSSCTCE